MEITDALKMYLSRFQLIIDLQKNLLDLDEDNYDEMITIIEKMPLFDDYHTFCHFLESIDSAIYARPKKFKIYLKLIIRYEQKIKKEFDPFALHRIIGSHIVNYHLYKHGFYTDEIFREISQKHDSEIQILLEMIESSSDPEKTSKLLLEGRNPEDYLVAIQNDDVDSLISIISQRNLNVNDTIEYFEYEISYFFKKQATLIEYSAFYGSVNCFKYLLNQCDLNYSPLLAEFAIAGGNHEIIHLVENHSKFNTNILEISIQFHHYLITDYLLNTHNINNDLISSLAVSIRFYNLDYFVHNITKATDINKQIIRFWQHENLLSVAVDSGQLDIVEFLLSIKNIDVFQPGFPVFFSFQKTPLEIAKEANENEIVKLLEEKIRSQE
ncbi:hypothetical protein TRFO_19450 [Tritrichomonas foetus]|uniref:DUF3447 domain-containing protein n=1 Tax=Tritrichomonas foetus TaxID=1144522 RepID=A0A1J4KMW8_9EUKA|nr:hypothetical protein TRFO_19450 [Tritrichomonas foetus]|eukprot:OHT11046.1 hypothetical protein TRFO_19450 [Tritrichomonas foetus]